MYVCVCNAVTEKHIHSAVAEGVTTLKDLKRELGVGAECGRCLTCAKACLKEANGGHHHAAKPQKIQPIHLHIAA